MVQAGHLFPAVAVGMRYGKTTGPNSNGVYSRLELGFRVVFYMVVNPRFLATFQFLPRSSISKGAEIFAFLWNILVNFSRPKVACIGLAHAC